jgi:hypothetical protein
MGAGVNILPPVANPVSAAVAFDSSANNIPLSITGGAPSSVHVSTAPVNGTATPSGLTIAYTPNSGFSGPDPFAYTATNAGGTSAPATASITVNPFAPVTNTYTSGSGTETVPTGASQCVITAWGGGACGAGVTGHGIPGGGGGAQSIKTIAVTGGDTLSYSVAAYELGTGSSLAGTGNPSTVTGTVAGGAVNMTANGGAGSLGGAASGGDTNTSGGNASGMNGGAGANGGSGGSGGVSSGGSPGAAPGGGGGGGNSGEGFFGAAGEISFSYT